MVAGEVVREVEEGQGRVIGFWQGVVAAAADVGEGMERRTARACVRHLDENIVAWTSAVAKREYSRQCQIWMTARTVEIARFSQMKGCRKSLKAGRASELSKKETCGV
jgi:hypothetical protein